MITFGLFFRQNDIGRYMIHKPSKMNKEILELAKIFAVYPRKPVV